MDKTLMYVLVAGSHLYRLDKNDGHKKVASYQYDYEEEEFLRDGLYLDIEEFRILHPVVVEFGVESDKGDSDINVYNGWCGGVNYIDPELPPLMEVEEIFPDQAE